jgi:tetratricopeptide (TPR) repeat protein
MSGSTTNSSKREMDCATVAREEILEGYLVGRLTEEDREAFEEHYFECADCFDDVRSLQAIQGELRQGGGQVQARQRAPSFRWFTAAGLCLIAVPAVLMLWMRPAAPPRSSDKSAPRPQAQLPDKTTAQPPPLAVASGPSLEELARVIPPGYEPLKLGDVSDEATTFFQSGMEHYRKADYPRALDDLREAGRLDPDAPHILFFLGISDLMLGHDDAAIARLRETIALGDSPYLDEAHLYLAKAYLRRKDVASAEIHLRSVIDLSRHSRVDRSRSAEAKRLLAELARGCCVGPARAP